jgi:hypothetical protein
MSIPLIINGQTFEYPVNFDENWGTQATGWAQAVTNGMLQRQGGNFPLLADANFGTSFGLVAEYYKSESSNIASTGLVRLSNTDTIDWRNFGNTADLPLGVNSSNQLTFNGSALSFTGAVNSGTQYQLTYYAATGNTVSGLTLITPNMALESNSNGLPVASSVSSTTLSYLDATSSIQTQINSTVAVANAALPKSGGTMTGGIVMGGNLSFTTTSTEGIVGTTTNDSAATGNTGEYIESVVSPGPFLIGNGNSAVFNDMTSISLTAGDWDVTFNATFFNQNGNTWTVCLSGISTIAGNHNTGLLVGSNEQETEFASSTTTPIIVPMTIANYRMSLASTTTVYAKVAVEYSAFVGNFAVLGRLSARRMR